MTKNKKIFTSFVIAAGIALAWNGVVHAATPPKIDTAFTASFQHNFNKAYPNVPFSELACYVVKTARNYHLCLAVETPKFTSQVCGTLLVFDKYAKTRKGVLGSIKAQQGYTCKSIEDSIKKLEGTRFTA